MSAVATLKGFVNTWECDENDHLNVQFYYRFFEDAAAHFQSLAGIAPSERSEPVVRHVRFHAELRVNAAIHVESLGIGEDGRQAVHMLYESDVGESDAGRLSATCLETYAEPAAGLVEALRRHRGEAPGAALPRSVGADAVFAGPERGSPPGAALVLASRIRAAHCRPDGSVFDSAIIGLNSDSAAHFWDVTGVDRAFLESRGLGRVAVEMKLTRANRLRLGDLVHVVSRPIAVGRSTVTFENRFVRTDSEDVDAIVQVTGLTMDLSSRRAVALPDDLRERVADMTAR